MALPPRACENCGAKTKQTSGRCDACGFVAQTPRYGTSLELVFCPTCGCVYEEGCAFFHETQPYKPKG